MTHHCCSCLILFWLQGTLISTQPIPNLVLPEERTTGLGCIQEGKNVSYVCTVTDPSDPPIGSTVWSGSDFKCPGTSNVISLTHFSFQSSFLCGDFVGKPLQTIGNRYVSSLSFIARTELHGSNVSCSLSSTMSQAASDTLTVGVVPAPPKTPKFINSFGSSFTVSWSPPSDPVEGGVGGYVFDVTGEGCGCVSMNVSSDTTSVTCSGWTAAGQICYFEVRTVSQDCGFISSPVSGTHLLTATCDPAELGDISSNNHGIASAENGKVLYNGIQLCSTAYLVCNDGYARETTSKNRTCLCDGHWSGEIQKCRQITSTNAELAALILPIILAILIVLFTTGIVTGFFCLKCQFLQKTRKVCCVILTCGGLVVGIHGRRKYKGFSEPPFKLKFIAKSTLNTQLKMSRSTDAVAYNNVAYFRPYGLKDIYKFDSRSHSNKWSQLAKCPVNGATLVILPTHKGINLEFVLHTVGGSIKKRKIHGNLINESKNQSGSITEIENQSGLINESENQGGLINESENQSNDKQRTLVDYLHCYSMEDNSWNHSTVYDKPMKTPRRQVTAVWDDKYLIVAGGRGKDGPSKTVELLNLLENTWSFAAPLPKPVYRASGCVVSFCLYILGGRTYDNKSEHYLDVKSGFKVSLNKLAESQCDKEPPETGVFQRIEDAPFRRSVYVTVSDNLVAIGGTKNDSTANEAVCVDNVYTYDFKENLWKLLPDKLSTARCYCTAASFVQPPKVMVVGGYTSSPESAENCTKTVEIAGYDRSASIPEPTGPTEGADTSIPESAEEYATDTNICTYRSTAERTENAGQTEEVEIANGTLS